MSLDDVNFTGEQRTTTEREEIASSLTHEYISISKTKKTANNECHEVNKRKHQEKYLNFNRVFFFKWRSINLIIKAESVI